MSWEVVGLVYRKKLGSHIRKTVLAYLADKASDDGRGIWVSKGNIAKALECGRSTVIRTVNEFVEEGILVPVGRRPCVNGETVEYDISLGVLGGLDDLGGPVPQRDQSTSGTSPRTDQSRSGTPPVPQRDPYQSRSGTQTSLSTIQEPPSSKKAARATRLSPEWKLPRSWGQWAIDAEGVDELFVRREADRFRDYWIAKDKNAAKTNWEATWRNWIRKAAEERGQRSNPNNSQQRMKSDDKLAIWLDAARNPRNSGMASGSDYDPPEVLLGE